MSSDHPDYPISFADIAYYYSARPTDVCVQPQDNPFICLPCTAHSASHTAVRSRINNTIRRIVIAWCLPDHRHSLSAAHHASSSSLPEFQSTGTSFPWTTTYSIYTLHFTVHYGQTASSPAVFRIPRNIFLFYGFIPKPGGKGGRFRPKPGGTYMNRGVALLEEDAPTAVPSS